MGVPLHLTTVLPGEAQTSHSPVTWLGFSPDGNILYHGADRILQVTDFILEDNTPTPELCPHATVVFNSPLRGVEICPTANRIAVVTRSPSLYLWDGLGVEGVTIPAGKLELDNSLTPDSTFNPTSLHWAPDGHSVAVCGKTAFCLVYEELQAEKMSKWEDE